jgi:hypothetical protein
MVFNRQGYGESCALPHLTFNPDGPAMQFDQRFGDRQTQAGVAVRFPVGQAFTGKLLKNRR